MTWDDYINQQVARLRDAADDPTLFQQILDEIADVVSEAKPGFSLWDELADRYEHPPLSPKVGAAGRDLNALVLHAQAIIIRSRGK